ncbi:MAG: hypothetical protein KatS3mg081_0600 [Gemmatimonadales bacterium]|nr:MAG: hypothetical protein KatS3mg081_0600 [Gemmatimonadales bacterium]
MKARDFVEKWAAEAERLRRYGALVDGARLIDDLLEDFRALEADEANALLTLQEAARESGYSADHLGRLIRQGRIPNSGRPGAPLIRRGDLPLKPGLRRRAAAVHLLGARQLVRAIVEEE